MYVSRLSKPSFMLSLHILRRGVIPSYTLFNLARYRHECAGPDLYREMKLVIGQFGAPLTELAKVYLYHYY